MLLVFDCSPPESTESHDDHTLSDVPQDKHSIVKRFERSESTNNDNGNVNMHSFSLQKLIHDLENRFC